MIRSMDAIVQMAGKIGRKRIVVAAAQDEDILRSIDEAYKMQLVDVTLIGNKEKILTLADTLKIDVSTHDIIKEVDAFKAARIAVDIVSSRRADILMKGHIQTADLLKAVLDKDIGLRMNHILSHVSVIELERYPKLLFVTDAGMNIAPDVNQKADIIQNAVNVARSLGVEKPKVAVLAAIEMINTKMPATLDAAILSKMADRGQIQNCIIDGPLAMDNAINLGAARHKGIESHVAGDADILLVPDIEAGNILQKSLVFLAGGKTSGIIAGARAPIVVTSRADDYMAKLYSIALACLCSQSTRLVR